MPKGGQLSGPLAEAFERFEAGDKVQARAAAEAVLAASPSPEDAERANELLMRLKLPVAVWRYAALAAGAIAVLITLALFRS